MLDINDKRIIKIFVVMFFLMFLLGFLNFLFKYDGYENIMSSKKIYNTCMVFLNSSREEKEELILKYSDSFGLDDETCTEYTKYGVPVYSAFSLYSNVLEVGDLSFVIPFFLPIIIIFPAVYIITKKYRSIEIKNYILRDSFKKYMKKIFKIAYSNILLYPIVLLLVFIVSLLITGSFNPTADVNLLLINSELANIYNNPILYILYFVIILSNVGMYNNIVLSVTSRNKNFLIAYIESFLLIYIVWCISEIVIGISFQSSFGISASNFSLLNIVDWVGVDNVLIFFITNIFWFLVTLFIAIYCCKDKERLICMCER